MVGDSWFDRHMNTFVLGSILVGVAILGLLAMLIHDLHVNACQRCFHPVGRHNIETGTCYACDNYEQFIPKGYQA